MVKSKMEATVNALLSGIEKKNNIVDSIQIDDSAAIQEPVKSENVIPSDSGINKEVPKRRRGRPSLETNNHRFTLVLNEDMYQECCRRAEEEFMSVNQFIKRLIRDELNRV